MYSPSKKDRYALGTVKASAEVINGLNDRLPVVESTLNQTPLRHNKK